MSFHQVVHSVLTEDAEVAEASVIRGDQMDIHKNARLTPRSRAELVRRVLIERQTPKAVAAAFGVCVKTVRKWVGRFLAEGEAGLTDRSSRPHRLRQPTPQAVVDEIERLRRELWTGKQIAAETDVSPATVSRVLRRLGLNKSSVPWSRLNQFDATNVTGQANSSTSISRSWGGSALSAIASPADILAQSTVTRASAGNTCMSASTMPRASLSCRSCPTNAKRVPSPSLRRLLLTWPNSVFRSSA